jgi:hypothetical protein
MRRLFKGESRFWSGCSASAGSENAVTPISGKLLVPDVGVLFWGGQLWWIERNCRSLTLPNFLPAGNSAALRMTKFKVVMT